jgi:hypothetical protein
MSAKGLEVGLASFSHFGQMVRIRRRLKPKDHDRVSFVTTVLRHIEEKVSSTNQTSQ